MNIEERIKLCRLISEMESHKDYCRRIGLVNRSRYKNDDLEHNGLTERSMYYEKINKKF